MRIKQQNDIIACDTEVVFGERIDRLKKDGN